ncbi:coiled-coil domain-containing protein 150-like isoform X1 [Cyclopterus lumpus]|uniref:coiled-coil domain-containing protein 150-like isoform X1 n=1 Tax=Cyclopterus lumpus TaxID=8103 RepID=UPI0014869693|nr:coiled-coil domain-containing protein 150-like isoform X1 [Cyclopterus lumpus]
MFENQSLPLNVPLSHPAARRPGPRASDPPAPPPHAGGGGSRRACSRHGGAGGPQGPDRGIRTLESYEGASGLREGGDGAQGPASAGLQGERRSPQRGGEAGAEGGGSRRRQGGRGVGGRRAEGRQTGDESETDGEKMRRQLEEEAERRWALRTRLIEQLRNQDLLLEATRRNAHSELQVALTDKVNLQLELEKLKDGHSRLLQSSSAAREAAATQREVLERTIERLRGELSTARQQESGTEFREQEAADGQTLETNQASRDELHLKQEDSARLQAQREIGKHRAEVEKLQWLLTSTHSKSSRALESLQKASDAARVINKRLAQSLERHRVAAALRDEELLEARSKIGRLSEELGAAKRRRREDESAETPRREPSELTRSAGDSSAGSGDLSTANRELRRRASELERLVSEQTAFIREQRSRELHKAEVSPQQEAELERWTSTIRRWEAKRALADTDKKRRSDTVTL